MQCRDSKQPHLLRKVCWVSCRSVVVRGNERGAPTTRQLRPSTVSPTTFSLKAMAPDTPRTPLRCTDMKASTCRELRVALSGGALAGRRKRGGTDTRDAPHKATVARSAPVASSAGPDSKPHAVSVHSSPRSTARLPSEPGPGASSVTRPKTYSGPSAGTQGASNAAAASRAAPRLLKSATSDVKSRRGPQAGETHGSKAISLTPSNCRPVGQKVKERTTEIAIKEVVVKCPECVSVLGEVGIRLRSLFVSLFLLTALSWVCLGL